MNILALETSSAMLAVALYTKGQFLEKNEELPLQHAPLILPTLETLLKNLDQPLDLLVWGAGPGSFTGLRIGASVIQALGFVHNIPIVMVSSLAALAQTFYDTWGHRKLLVAVDARMQELYCGAYQISEAGLAEPVGVEALLKPEELVAQTATWALEEWVGLGSAWSIYQAELSGPLGEKLGKIDSECLPRARALVQLGRLKYERGEQVEPSAVLPEYLRTTVVNLK